MKKLFNRIFKKCNNNHIWKYKLVILDFGLFYHDWTCRDCGIRPDKETIDRLLQEYIDE